MPKNTQVPVPPPPTDRRDPPTPNHTRTADQRLPDLKHLLPSWYPKQAFIGDVYPQQLGDNNPNYDQIADNIQEANRRMDKDPHDNRFYKQEAPIERPDRSTYQPNPEKGVQPRPENQHGYQHVRKPDARKSAGTIGGQFSNGTGRNSQD